MVKKLYEWKPICTRSAGRPKVGWENDTKDLRIIKINNWSICIQDGLSGRKQLRRPKLSSSELVAPDEEEEASISLVSCIFKWYGRELKWEV